MSSYMALYRKFRPLEFSEVKGQDHIVTTLKNEIEADRIGHAYLFVGTRGTGKTTVAKIFAKAVNCEHPKEDGSPCGECDVCRAISDGSSMNVVEMDAASNNGVDNIRSLIEDTQYPPTSGKYKVYIIDEAHMLSKAAFNAFLKTLEEPPEYVIFILATTEVNAIPLTIISRCQRYNFHRISVETIAARLSELLGREGVEYEDKAVDYIARAGDGSMRDALSLLDECINFYLGQKLTYENVLKVLGAVDIEVFSRLLRYILDQDVKNAISVVDEVVTEGRDLTQFVNDFIWYLRNMLLVKSDEAMAEVLDLSNDNKELLIKESKNVEEEVLMRYIRIFSDLSNDIRMSTQKRVALEVTVIRLCHPETEKDYESVINRIEILEKKIAKGIPVAAAAPGQSAPVTSAEAVKKVPLPDILPEEVQDLVPRWKDIIRDIGTPLDQCLQMAVPTVVDGQFTLVFDETSDGQMQLMYDLIQQEGNRNLLQKTLDEAVGKHVNFKLLLNKDKALAEEKFTNIISDFEQKSGMKVEVE